MDSTSVKSPAILLSGASGMLGSALRDAFARTGARSIQLVRRPPSAPDQVQWDPAAANPVEHAESLESAAAAIHLSGANVAAGRWTSPYRREMFESRVGSTRALANLLASLRHPPPVLLVASATGIYGDRGDALLTERSEPGSGFLAEVCQAWEAAAQPAADAGIRVVHLRFGVVLGRGAGALAKMLPLFRLGLGGRLGSGNQWMSWIALEDAVAAVRFLTDAPLLSGPFNLVAPQPLTNRDFTRALARQLHRPAFVAAPAFALRLALGQMADEALLASARVVPERLIEAGFKFQFPTIQEALAEALR